MVGGLGRLGPFGVSTVEVRRWVGENVDVERFLLRRNAAFQTNLSEDISAFQ